MKNDKKHTIAIIGTGLIGCSMAEGLRSIANEIIGVDNNYNHLQEAIYRGIIDRSLNADSAIELADLIIIAIPVDKTIEILPGILSKTRTGTVVIDAGSIKGDICNAVFNHPARERFVAAHPMAGLPVTGPGASDSRMFQGRKVVICEKELSAPESIELAVRVFDLLKMDIIYLEPEIHDVAVSEISHLPQIVAYALSSMVGRDNMSTALKIASTGFESSTRISSSPAEMWVPIFRHNRVNISNSLDSLITVLQRIKYLIDKGNWEAVEEIIIQSNNTREAFLAAHK